MTVCALPSPETVEECRFSPDTCCTHEKCVMWENCKSDTDKPEVE